MTSHRDAQKDNQTDKRRWRSALKTVRQCIGAVSIASALCGNVARGKPVPPATPQTSTIQSTLIKSDISRRMETPPVTYTAALEKMKTATGGGVFYFEASVRLLWSMRIPEDSVRSLIALRMPDGKNAFNNETDIIEWYVLGKDAAFAKELLDKDARKLLTKQALMRYAKYALPTEYFEKASQLKNEQGEYVFTDPMHIIRHGYGSRDLELAAEVSSRGLTSTETYRTIQLGLTPEEYWSFWDTEKPNAIIVYPTYDPHGVFENKNMLQLDKQIRKNYDVRTVITDNENDVYTALDETPDISLLVLNGHGSRISLQLGKNDRASNLADSIRNNESTFIDTSDCDFFEHTQNLLPDATIALNSCLTGRGEDNLASFIAQTGRTVLAPRDAHMPEYAIITSIKPLRMRFLNTNDVHKIDYSKLSTDPLAAGLEDVTAGPIHREQYK